MVVCLAIAIRVAAVLVLQSHDVPRSTYEHGEIAANLLAGRGFSMHFLGADGPTSQQAPVYPAIVALAYGIGGVETPQALLLLELGQSVLGGLLVLGVIRLARLIAPGRDSLAWVAGLVVAIHPTLIYAATHVQVAGLGATLLTWTLVLAYQAGASGRVRDAILTGWLLALLALTDPILTLVSPGVVWAVWLGQSGVMKSWSCTSRASIPILLRVFPPLAKGGLGGVVPARPITRSAKGGEDRLVRTRASEQMPEELKISALAVGDTPPDPPSERGGDLAARAQQNDRRTGDPVGPVKANFSPARCGSPQPRSRVFRLMTVTAIVAAVGIAPWLVRNIRIHGEFVAIKSTFGYAFWQGNCALSEGTDKVVRSSVQGILDRDQNAGGLKGLNRAIWEARHEAGYIDDIALSKDDIHRLGSVSEPQRSRILFNRAVADLKLDPARYARLCLRRLRYFLLFDETNPKSRVLVYRLAHLGLSILAVMGLWLAGPAPRKRLMPTIVTVAAIALFHSLTIVSARFHIPIEPLLAIWGAAGLTCMAKTLGSADLSGMAHGAFNRGSTRRRRRPDHKPPACRPGTQPTLIVSAPEPASTRGSSSWPSPPH